MLKIYDISGKQLGLIVGEFEKDLLVWIGNHSVEHFNVSCLHIREIEAKSAKKLHLNIKDYSTDSKKIERELREWWEQKCPGLDFKYHSALVLFNISKKDWSGINFLSDITSGVFTLISYRDLLDNRRLTYSQADFLSEVLKDGKYLSMIVEDHPEVVTFEKLKPWDTTKKDSGVYTQLSLRCGEKIINKKLPYFVYAKKGDKLLLEITDGAIPKTFVNGIRYSYVNG